MTTLAVLLLVAALQTPASFLENDVVGGVLPLAHGFYVSVGAPCSLPPNAAIQSYDGEGLGDPHSSQCRLTVLSRHRRVVTASNSCLDAGAGPAPRSSETLKIRVDGVDRYSLLAPGQRPARFRWCPAVAVQGR